MNIHMKMFQKKNELLLAINVSSTFASQELLVCSHDVSVIVDINYLLMTAQ